MKKALRTVALICSWALLGLSILAWFNRQAVLDWWRVRQFQPPQSIQELAKNDDMTSAAQHYFYASRPELDGKQAFVSECKVTEQTIVLGCYTGPQKIYLLKVTDARLDGVEQVTAAHEMLHAAYDRLSSSEKQKVNDMVERAYQTVADPRIKSTMQLYQKTEPHSIDNELHSILGTEVATLPSDLENYYKQYFHDRQKIVQYSKNYEQALTSRRQQAQALLEKIHTQEANITSTESRLAAEHDQLQAQRGSIDTREEAISYNAKVDAYNAEIYKLKKVVNSYNDMVNTYNGLLVEEKSLLQEIDANSVPKPTQD